MGTEGRARRGNRDDAGCWQLLLYVASTEPRSTAALANLKQLCDEHLPGRYRIQVVDLLKTPQRSQDDQILAIPTLVRRWPLPEKRMIGTLSDSGRVTAALLDATG